MASMTTTDKPRRGRPKGKLTGQALADAQQRMATARAARGKPKPLPEDSPPLIPPDTLDPDSPYLLALDHLATGLTTRAACTLSGVTPRNLWLWQRRSDSNSTLYAHARQSQARAMADATVDIADQADAQNVQAKRLQVDTRKWVASKLDSSAWGDYVGAPKTQTLQIGSVQTLHLSALKELAQADTKALPSGSREDE